MKYEIHKLALLIPEMSADEYAELKNDIENIGLLTPITLYEGKILDGRHRYKACRELGIEPEFEYYNGDSPAAYVLSMNVFRRNLTPSQKAMVATDILPWYEQEAEKRQHLGQKIDQGGGRATEQVADLLGTNRQYVSDAKQIKELNPELAEQVRSGEKTIADAKKELRKQKTKDREQEALNNIPDEKLWTITDNQSVIQCDALITDPPYGILDEEWEPERLEEFTREWVTRWNECKADFILIFWSQRHMWSGKQWFDECLTNYDFTQLLIWHYPNNKKPQSRKMFKQTYEPVFFYRRKDSQKEIGIYGSEWGDGLNGFDCHVSATPQSNFNDSEMKQHPAQKSLSVMEWLVNVTTQAGELVIDPFSGSGTTGIAAVKMKRRFVGIEINSDYRALSERRISTYGV